MKKITMLFLMQFVFFGITNAQNIWDITGEYLKAQHELALEASIYPQTKENNRISLPFYIFTNKQSILDSNFIIQKSNIMSLYRFCSLNTHSRNYLLITLNGQWQIIDMKKSLSDIMMDGVNVSRAFKLDTCQTISFFQEIINLFELNLQHRNKADPQICELETN